MNTHVYVGPTTRWGLVKGTEGKKEGGRAGGVTFVRQDGARFTVGKDQVKPV